MQLFGENGLIAKSEQSKEFYEQAKDEEQNRLDKVEEYMGKYLNGYSGGNGGTGIPSTWDTTKVTAVDGGKGKMVPVPNGFYYVGGNIDTGFVISDKPGDTIDASGTSMGNQFVWIPVESEADLERTNFDNNGQVAAGLSSSFVEPYGSGHAAEASAYNTMKTQVLNYGGFYIGRFEAGINSTTPRTGTTTAQTVVSKKGVAPYNYVSWGEEMENVGSAGAAYLANNMYSTSGSVTSTLCYGCQWDAMCRYIGDSNRTTPTKTAIGLTGSVTTDVSKNIYDLAGNCGEWTMEANIADYRARRGGDYLSELSVSARNSKWIGTGDEISCFRVSFYIQ